MLRLTLKNLRANKVRFALTTLGVVLAVSFVVSAFVLGDGLRSTFGDVSEDITAGVDIRLRQRPIHRHHGTIRVRQVDAHALHGWP